MKESKGSSWWKYHRKMEEWEWINDLPVLRIFLYLLSRANFKEEVNWKGIVLKKGELITSTVSISEACKLSRKTVRDSLKKLEKTGEIGQQTTNKYTLITVNNYSVYQGNEDLMATEQHSTGQQSSQQPANNRPHIRNTRSKKKERTSLQATPVGENLNFNTPEKMTIEQELDAKLFWDRLLKVYNPVGDKSLHNTSLKKQREKIIITFTVQEREKILEWFTKYKTQLEIAGTWLGNFFKDHPTMDSIAEYFRSIKDVKSNVKNKSVGELLKRNTKEDFDSVQAYDPFANK
jgi:hypothetical protein